MKQGPDSQWRYLIGQMMKNRNLIVGLSIIFPLVIMTLFAPLLATHDPQATNPGAYLVPPGEAHLLGTDSLGLDVFSRLLYAPRIDLTIAFLATALGLLSGVPLGLYVGYFAGVKGIHNAVSSIIMRIMDVIQAFPVFVLGLALVSATGQNISNVIYVLAFLWVPIYTRLIRAEVLSVREHLYIEQARAVGNTTSKIIFKHILPNVISPAITQTSVIVAASILLTAGLSFVGAGVRMPTPEWGLMISVGAKNMITGHWWPSFFPGLFLCLTIYGLSVLGEGLATVLDPRNWK